MECEREREGVEGGGGGVDRTAVSKRVNGQVGVDIGVEWSAMVVVLMAMK
jgi:hypothetical protein